MSFVLVILVSLILATPLTIIFDGPNVPGLLAAVAAISLAIVGLRIRPREAGFLLSVIGPVALVAALPAIWMLVQAMPLSGSGLAHPIWKSAGAALGLPMAGSISIDPGATLVSFVRYLSATAIAFVAAAVAIERRRAEWIFFTLTVALILIALMSLAVSLGVFTFPNSEDFGQRRVAAIDCAGLGIIFTAAAALHTSERSKERKSDQTVPWISPTFVVWLAGLAICLLAVIIDATGATYFAVIFAVATFVAAGIIRRFGLGSWGIAAIVSIIMLAALAAVAVQPSIRTLDFTLAFAAHARTALIAVTQRVVSETAWTGTGAGTFAAILPIYGDIDELATGHIAPTAAAAIAVEMGRPFFWAILLAATALALALVRGALSRQRDSYYSTAGASCVVAITLLLFSNVGPLSTSVMLIGSVAIGIAIAQSKSRYV
jgi:hypothetical protein